MNVEEQFRWIVELLNRYEVPYWLDSGTLLGVIRDGKLLAHDKDIDLSMWVEDEKKLRRVVPAVRKDGYKVVVSAYKGMSYKYVFKLTGKTELFKISIHLFRKTDGYAWCPQERPVKRRYYSGNLARQLFRLSKAFVIYGYKKHFARRISYNLRVWKLFHDIGTWWIPLSYFEKIIPLPEKNTFIPEKYRDYLEFRYGNWRVPDKNWSYWRNEKLAFKRVHPEVLLGI